MGSLAVANRIQTMPILNFLIFIFMILQRRFGSIIRRKNYRKQIVNFLPHLLILRCTHFLVVAVQNDIMSIIYYVVHQHVMQQRKNYQNQMMTKKKKKNLKI